MAYFSGQQRYAYGVQAPPIPFVPDNGYRPLESDDVELIIRQQPREGLIALDGKEKTRKPIDPPPFVEIKVKPPSDPNRFYLHSPYLFMTCHLINGDNEQTALTQDGRCGLTGTVASSLHRLKDIDNRDAGFFVFGDVSGKVPGMHRLHFRLWDLRIDEQFPRGRAFFLKSVLSEPFNIVLPKDFKGLEESTYLSRAFSDQGVRLRLRKEPRSLNKARSKKRSFDEYAQDVKPETADRSGFNVWMRDLHR